LKKRSKKLLRSGGVRRGVFLMLLGFECGGALAQSAPAPFAVARWASLPGPANTLNLANLQDATGAEQITVYARRRHASAPPNQLPAFALGPARLTGTDSARQATQSGLAITAAIPLAGVPGLDATLTAFGGHDAVNTSTTATTASLTAGLRLKF